MAHLEEGEAAVEERDGTRSASLLNGIVHASREAAVNSRNEIHDLKSASADKQGIDLLMMATTDEGLNVTKTTDMSDEHTMMMSHDLSLRDEWDEIEDRASRLRRSVSGREIIVLHRLDGDHLDDLRS